MYYPLLIAFVVPALLVALLGFLTCLHKGVVLSRNGSSRTWFLPSERTQYLSIHGSSCSHPESIHYNFDPVGCPQAYKSQTRLGLLRMPIYDKLRSDSLTKTWSV